MFGWYGGIGIEEGGGEECVDGVWEKEWWWCGDSMKYLRSYELILMMMKWQRWSALF
jgi:hypothetical protein